MNSTLKSAATRHVVLVGAGHTHAQILRRWGLRQIPGATLTCVSIGPVATYSGMLPGVLAGQYRSADMQIDVSRLCEAAGARLVVGEPRALDLAAGTLAVSGHPPLPFDVLSIGIGSTTAMDGVAIDAGAPLVAVKPMPTFLDRLDAAAERAAFLIGERPLRVTVVGGGAGGIEIAFTLPVHLGRRLGGESRILVTMVTGTRGLHPGTLASTTRRVRRVLEARGVRIVSGRRVVGADRERVWLDGATAIETDLIVWVTSASAPPLLLSLGLPTDSRGFLLTDACLQTTAGAPVFAVGDSGTIAGVSTPKAGVYAVRQGPVLWENIRRMLAGAPLRPYVPQRDFLRLLNTGDGRAIGEWKGLSFEGRWCWWWKDWIDRRFMARYQVG